MPRKDSIVFSDVCICDIRWTLRQYHDAVRNEIEIPGERHQVVKKINGRSGNTHRELKMVSQGKSR
jgi:hypothetical protein